MDGVYNLLIEIAFRGILYSRKKYISSTELNQFIKETTKNAGKRLD